MRCKYCGEEFDNKGKLLSHYKTCPAKVSVLVEEPNADISYVLVPVEDYIPVEWTDAEVAGLKDKIIRLERVIEKQKQSDAEVDGELYWPMSRLPKELGYLADGQFVSLKATGRIRGDKVLVQDVKV